MAKTTCGVSLVILGFIWFLIFVALMVIVPASVFAVIFSVFNAVVTVASGIIFIQSHNKEISSGNVNWAAFCPHCGLLPDVQTFQTELPEPALSKTLHKPDLWICPKCHDPCRGMNFCMKCGHKLT